MTTDTATRAAEMLTTAWRDGSQIAELPGDLHPASRDAAYNIQDEMARLLGWEVVGWKMGMTSAPTQRQFGADAPLPGRLFREVMYEAPATVAAGGLTKPIVEPEFAVRLSADLPPRDAAYTRDEVAAATAAIHLAIEIASYRVAMPEVVPLRIVADNGGSAGCVIGPEVADWRSVDFLTVPVALHIDGALAAPGLTGNARIDPVDVTAWLANDLSARGIGLTAGAYVLTGSATAPTRMDVGSEVVARFEGLGEVRLRFAE